MYTEKELFKYLDTLNQCVCIARIYLMLNFGFTREVANGIMIEYRGLDEHTR